MNYIDFQNSFSTEAQCRDYIFKVRWEDGYRCPQCQCDKAWKTNEHKYKCQNCGHKASVTSGTIFQDSHIPLPTWFKAMWYISEQRRKVTAAELQRELNLGSNRTALSMLKKLERAMYRRRLTKLKGTVEVSTHNMKIGATTHLLIFAMEMNGKNVQRIRIRQFEKEDPMDVPNFVDDCIVPNSTIQHRNWALQKLVLYNEYEMVLKPQTYEFTRAKKVFNKLKAWLNNYPLKMELSKRLDFFCTIVNSSKTPIEFEEFARNAIKMSPSDYIHKIYKVKL